ncbi:MAG TPA: hypothetical protein VF488_10475 [Gemmatimonadaceae bacterium]
MPGAEIADGSDQREPGDVVECGEVAQHVVREQSGRRHGLVSRGGDEHGTVRRLARVVVVEHDRGQPGDDRAFATAHVEHDESVRASFAQPGLHRGRVNVLALAGQRRDRDRSDALERADREGARGKAVDVAVRCDEHARAAFAPVAESLARGRDSVGSSWPVARS